MAFTAVQMEFSRFVSSPVPWALLPSSRTNLVRVRTLVSKAPLSDILLSGVGLGPNALSEIGEQRPNVKKWTQVQRKGKVRGVCNSFNQSKVPFLTAGGWFDHFVNCGFKRAKFKDRELFFFCLAFDLMLCIFSVSTIKLWETFGMKKRLTSCVLQVLCFLFVL